MPENLKPEEKLGYGLKSSEKNSRAKNCPKKSWDFGETHTRSDFANKGQ